MVRSGGTILAVAELRRLLDAPVVVMGFGLREDGIHAPNERLHLPTFHRGIETVIAFLEEVGRRVDARRPAAPTFTRFRP